MSGCWSLRVVKGRDCKRSRETFEVLELFEVLTAVVVTQLCVCHNSLKCHLKKMNCNWALKSMGRNLRQFLTLINYSLNGRSITLLWFYFIISQNDDFSGAGVNGFKSRLPHLLLCDLRQTIFVCVPPFLNWENRNQNSVYHTSYIICNK